LIHHRLKIVERVFGAAHPAERLDFSSVSCCIHVQSTINTSKYGLVSPALRGTAWPRVMFVMVDAVAFSSGMVRTGD